MHERYPAGTAGYGNALPYCTVCADPWYRWCDPCFKHRFFYDLDSWSGSWTYSCGDHCSVPGGNAKIHSITDAGR